MKVSNKPQQFWVIKVEGLEKKGGGDFGSKVGYIYYEGKSTVSSEQKGRWWTLGISKKTVFKDQIDIDNLEVVTDKDDASLFTNEDADTFIKAIKNNPQTKTFGVKFSKESVTPEEAKKSIDYPKHIFETYVKKLCDDDVNVLNYIRPGESQIYSIISAFNKPLAGDNFLRIFTEAYKNGIPQAWLTDRSVITMNNLIAKGVFSSADLIKPEGVKSSIMFNPDLYKYQISDIMELFETFDSARGKFRDSSNIKNDLLKGMENAGIQTPRHILLKFDDDDLFKAIANGADGDVSKIHQFGKDLSADESLITSGVRTSTEASDLFMKLGGGKKDKDSDRSIDKSKEVGLICMRTVSGRKKKGQLKLNINEIDEDEVEFTSKVAVDFKTGDKFKVIYADPTTFTDDWDDLKNILTDITKVKDSIKLTTDNELEFKVDKDGIRLNGKILIGRDGKARVLDFKII